MTTPAATPGPWCTQRTPYLHVTARERRETFGPLDSPDPFDQFETNETNETNKADGDRDHHAAITSLTRRSLLLSAGAGGLWWGAPAAAQVHTTPRTDTATTLRIGGVGSVTPILKRLATTYEQQHPGVQVQVVGPPLGSSGSVRALAAGKLEVAVTGRVLSSQERGYATPWVRTPLVLATSHLKATGLSLQQVADAYGGRMSTWPDGQPLRLVLRSAFESETFQLKTLSPEVAQAVDAALQRRDLPVPDNDLAALELIARLNGSLGSSSLGLMLSTQAKVRALRIEGREPTLAHLLSGAYPWSRTYHLVQPAQPSEAVRRWVEFLRSDAALRSLQPLGYAVAA